MTSALRKKLLSLAIRGKLVPQDPADEPASVLLERIRAEREAKENESPRRGRGRRSSSDNPPCPKRGTSAGTASAEGTVFEPPFPIPESWAWTTLENVGRFISGKTPSKQELTERPGVPYFKISEMNRPGNIVWMMETESFLVPDYSGPTFPALSIVFPKNGGAVLTNKRRLLKQVSVCDLNTGGVSLFDNDILGWVYLWFQTIDFAEHIFGGIIPTINATTVNSLCLPIPPLREQRAIVAKFKEIMMLCHEMDQSEKSLTGLAEKTKARILDLAIRGNLTPQNASDEPASSLLDRICSTTDKPPCPNRMSESFESPFPIPDTWEWTTIREINEYERKTLQPDPGSEEVFELYSVPVFESGLPEFVKGTEISSPKQVVQKGDVLVCKINPRINRVWNVAGHTDSRLLASSEWIVVRAKDIVSGYLKIVFQSPYFRAKLLTNVSGVGGSLMRAQAGFVMDYPFPIPPLAEQRRIVAKVEELFSTIDAMATK